MFVYFSFMIPPPPITFGKNVGQMSYSFDPYNSASHLDNAVRAYFMQDLYNDISRKLSLQAMCSVA